MPVVGGQHFPYTEQGKKDAKKAKKKQIGWASGMVKRAAQWEGVDLKKYKKIKPKKVMKRSN